MLDGKLWMGELGVVDGELGNLLAWRSKSRSAIALSGAFPFSIAKAVGAIEAMGFGGELP